MWLHTDSEVAPQDTDKKRQQHNPSQNQTKLKSIAQCLGYTVIRIGVGDDTVSLWLDALPMK